MPAPEREEGNPANRKKRYKRSLNIQLLLGLRHGSLYHAGKE